MTQPEWCPTHSEQVLSQVAGDTLVLLDPASGEYFALDEVGARIWELCDGTHSLAELVEILSGEYDAPSETIRADLLELLTKLETAQLLTRIG